jgi:DNA modification methylase
VCRESESGETVLHPTQKPVAVMAWCMTQAKVPEGATVLDPYMGSGSTIIAAIRTGRKAIGIEKAPEHFKTACERIKRELAQGDLFHGQNA